MAHQEVQSSPLEILKISLRGEVITPESPEYEKASKVWNWDHVKKPQALFRVLGASDVQKVLRFISTHNPPVPFTVKGGGHSMRCLSDGFVIDLSKMRSCRVDPATKTAQVDGGALLLDVYRETAEHGLFLPAGVVTHTGVGGLSLFGGVGWLCREFGLTSDHILEVDMVTADGQLRVVNKDSYPDLFWGVKGAGGCFGVVTSFKFRLVESTHIYAGPLAYPWPRYLEVFEAYRQYTISEEKFSRKEYDGLAATTIQGNKTALLVTSHHGPEVDWKANHQPFLELGPVFSKVQQHKTVDWFCSNDHTGAPGYWYEKGVNIDALSPKIGSIIAEAFEHSPTCFTTVLILPFGGKISDVPVDDTAYYPRESRFGINVECRWENPEEGERAKQWARALHAKLAPYKSSATYINFDADVASQGGTAYFGKHTERLQELKAKYDPTNVFRSISTP